MSAAEILVPLQPRVKELRAKLLRFVEERCIPAEEVFESQIGKGDARWKSYPQVIEELKNEARALGLWNLWVNKEFSEGAGLTNQEYAVLAEVTGRSALAPEACNCSAPDTGNMEVLLRYGSDTQKARWLTPLLRGEIRSSFLMTEPAVASSDATNISCTFHRVPGGGYRINGRKWWASGAMDPRCKIAVVLGKIVEEGGAGGQSTTHSQQTMLLVPMDTPGMTIVRPLSVFGYDDAPHGHAEILLEDVVVGPEALLLGEGKGFEIAQGRLGGGRVHHCMRIIGVTERALEAAADRATDPAKSAFKEEYLGRLGMVQRQLARGRASLEQSRLLVLACAAALDEEAAHSATGSKTAKTRQLVAMIKAAVPVACEHVIDDCLQIHGGGGVSQDFFLARALVGARTLRIADGPDEVHERSVARFELIRAIAKRKATAAGTLSKL
eukprot:CAMPEP_0185777942 /NCGR_PEP_ID=MMETSP1174-20130828/91257_1 /TAXON_ID=35687 /ORGANISM="Dictyocha speculum, Strain CCMP1381" /LENGTH=440 /DNA_ID=CAMNT_0028466515 /DNA_START=23 /DNA_END=1345 /DNA_ORIENTATION=-